MSVTPVNNKAELTYQFTNIFKGNEKKFTSDLKDSPPSVLKSACKALNIEFGVNKDETVTKIVQTLTKENGMNKDKKETPAPKKEEPTPKKEDAKKEPAPKKEPEKKAPTLNLIVDKKLKAMIPRPSKEDMARLEAAIKEQGFRSDMDKIKVLPDNRIVDGFTRFGILTKLKINITENMIEYVDLKPEDIEKYMYLENVARRHITDIEKIGIVQKLLPQIKKEVKKEVKEKGRKRDDAAAAKAKAEGKRTPKASGGHPTRDKVAEKAGVSPAQVKQHDFIKKYWPERLDEAIKNKEDVGTVYLQLRSMWDYLKRNDAKAWESVKQGDVSLKEAYDLAKMEEAKKGVKPEKKRGKFGSLVFDILGIYKKCYLKHSGKDKLLKEDLSAYDAEFIERIEMMLANFESNGK